MALPLVACSLLALAHAEEANVLFQRFARRYRVTSSLEVRIPPGGERGAYTTEPINAGEPVLVVPSSILLAARIDKEEPGILLTRQLLAAILDQNAVSSGQLTEKQQRFWQEWVKLLPKQGTLKIPVALPQDMLAELQDQELVKIVKMRQQHINSSLSDILADGKNADLQYWAAALCISRAFSNGKSMMMVPFLDMVNHHDSPNCKLSAQRGKKGKISKLGLIALRDLMPGEEVTYSYFDPMPNRHIFNIHGFVPEGNRHDRLNLPAGFAPLASDAWHQTMSANSGKWEGAEAYREAYREAVELSVPVVEKQKQDSKAEVAAATAIEQWLWKTAARDFSTTLTDDMATLHTFANQTNFDDGGIRREILRYRVQRKILWQAALDAISVHKQFHGGPEGQDMGRPIKKEDL